MVRVGQGAGYGAFGSLGVFHNLDLPAKPPFSCDFVEPLRTGLLRHFYPSKTKPL